MYTCEMQRGLRWSAAGDLTTASERSREVDAVCRLTVSFAVSPVGSDLVGNSVAERERVSPQRARFEGPSASRIASPLSLLSPGGMATATADTEVRAAFRYIRREPVQWIRMNWLVVYDCGEWSCGFQ